MLTDRENFFWKIFSIPTTLSTTPDGVKCNLGPIITLESQLTSIRYMLILKHNKGVESMPILSHQAYQVLKAQVKYKSYRVYRKYHKPVSFKTYAQDKAYCIKLSLNHKSSWVLTTVNHCA